MAKTRNVGFIAMLVVASLPTACAPRTTQPPPPHPMATPEMDADASANGIRIGEATLRVRFDGDAPVDAVASIEHWIAHSAEIVADYCGQFPVPELDITIVPGNGGGVGYGVHQDGRRVRVWVGKRTTEASLARDWVMVHELLHTAFPDLARRHRWMQEGLSTYLEPIVRARAGDLDEAYVWRKWVRMMDHGLPRAGDRGLDRTHTWGRTYWGGALFWLLADLEIRTRTDNRASIRDAVRGILAEGGNGRVAWSTEQVVRIGDAATGTTVLRDLYARMASAPGTVDLDALWTRLGVIRGANGTVRFDDTAPLAKIRRAMVSS